MSVLVLGKHELEATLDRAGLLQALHDGLKDLSLGHATNFSRTVYALDGADEKSRSGLGFMPAARSPHLLGYKVASVFHDNPKRGLNPHQGLVVILDAETGEVRALLEASTLTALRTAAVSALATQHLSRADSRTLTLIGTGRQAYEHAFAIAGVRDLERIILCGRTLSSTQALQLRLQNELNIAIEIESEISKALAPADIVVTCTASRQPLFALSSLRRGTHLNAIGASRPGASEVSFQTLPGLKIYLDSETACFSEASEIITPVESNELDRQLIIGELGSLLAGRVRGRETPDEITVFKSVGLGIEDLSAAQFFLAAAKQKRVGTRIDF